jgi:trigger factor
MRVRLRDVRSAAIRVRASSWWANVKRHVAEEITLLCDRHHREKTAGLLPVDRVEEANRRPFNFRTGVSKPYTLYYEGNQCEILLGTCPFTIRDYGAGTISIPFMIDGIATLGFTLVDGHLLLNLHLFDEDDNLLLRIANNQLVYSAYSWDIRLVRRTLTIRTGKGKYLLDIQFDPPNKVVVRRGRFTRNGVELLVMPDYLMIVNNRTLLNNVGFDDFPVAIAIGKPRPSLGVALYAADVPRPVADRSGALRWARERIKESKSRTSPGSAGPEGGRRPPAGPALKW